MLYITLNLNNGKYSQTILLHFDKPSNHPTQVINQSPKTINRHFSRNSPNQEVFSSTKQSNSTKKSLEAVETLI